LLLALGTLVLFLPGCSRAPQPPPKPAPPVAKYPVPADVQALAGRAADHLCQGDLADAAACYQRIVARHPDSLYAWRQLGAVRLQDSRLHLARLAFLHALQLAPRDTFSLAHLGLIEYQSEKYDAAIPYLTRAVALDDDPKTENCLGSCYSQQGRHDQAVKCFQRAIALYPTFGDAYLNLAQEQARYAPAQRAQARANYQKALALGVTRDPDLEKLLGLQTPSP
jgi:tetratricopeptide (TPR) repeat protein